MTAPLKRTRPADDFDPVAAVFASWTRALIGARPENKLTIFHEMARDAAVYVDAERQAAIDGMQMIAEEVGLIALVGTTTVHAALAAAFDGGAL
jgi:hypothetical protein